MQSYRYIKDMQLQNQWVKSLGLNPRTFFNPDLDANYIRALIACKQLLADHGDLLSEQQIVELESFGKQVTSRKIYQVLNLSKKIRRQLHKQK